MNDFAAQDQPLFPIEDHADLLKKVPELASTGNFDEISAVDALCLYWDKLSHGESPTTHAIRQAQAADREKESSV